MKKALCLIFVGLALMCLSGCASWYKPGVSSQATENAVAQCEYTAGLNHVERDNFVENCMIRQGFRLNRCAQICRNCEDPRYAKSKYCADIEVECECHASADTANYEDTTSFQEEKSPAVQADQSPAQKKQDIFYTGFALTYGMFDPYDYLGIDGDDDFSLNLEGGFTWLLRWYFYSAGSFQTGLGLFYSYSEYRDDGMLYKYASLNELTLEFPFTFRLGIPLAKAFAPYAEFSLNVRKPIYGWVDMEVEGYRYSTYDWYEYAYDAYRYAGDELSQSDFYSDEDWEFALWIGCGIEFTRHFAIDFLWLLGEENAGIAREYDAAWRTSLQFAW